MVAPIWLKVARIAGLVLHVLIGALLIFAGATKLAGATAAVEALSKMGMEDKLILIGAGELITALLLILPWTSKLGTLAASGFWGGVICTHMLQHDSYTPYAVFLAVTWLAAFLRHPEMLLPVPQYGTPVVKVQAEL
jgi:hypothetical protein